MVDKKIILILFLILIFCADGHAQSKADTTRLQYKPSVFLALGLGAVTPGGVFTIQLSIEAKKRNTFTAGSNFLTYAETDVVTPFFLWGRSHKKNIFYNRWGIGPSVSIVNTYGPGVSIMSHGELEAQKTGFGIHASWQFLLTGGPVGIGVEPFVDINTTKPYAGFVVIVGLGRINRRVSHK